MSEHELDIVGAWLLVLIKIWHTKTNGSITKTLTQYAKIMNTDQTNAQRILNYFGSENIADVTDRNGRITVVNRRTKRDANLLEQNRIRQQRYRASQENNADVVPPKVNPSSSSSSSSSSSPSSSYTITQVKDAAFLAGVSEDKAEQFYHHYNAQGWVFGNSQSVKDLPSALAKWRNSQFRFEKNDKRSGKKKLFAISGKTCGKKGCNMPAVWHSEGAYDNFYCLKHAPKEVRDEYD